jgi:hypothetical protein
MIETIAPVDSEERFEGLGVHVIREFARFISETEVEAGAHRHPRAPLRHRDGFAPLRAADPGPVGHAASYQRDDLRRCGSGPDTCHHRRRAHRDGDGAGAPPPGAKVTVLEGAKALGRDDPEAAALVLDALRAEGIGSRRGPRSPPSPGPRGP